MPISLAARNVSHRFGKVVALDGVSIDVLAGRAVALVGESGSGKTTLLRCFNSLVEPDQGEVIVGDRDVRTQPAVQLRRGIGYVQQHGGLLPHWRVLRNVALVPVLQGMSDPIDAARPGVVLLDEPFGALDAISRGELHESFDALRRSLSLTTLLVTHDLAEAARLADDIVVMKKGRIEQMGTMRTLITAPATEYVAHLIARARAGLEALQA